MLLTFERFACHASNEQPFCDRVEIRPCKRSRRTISSPKWLKKRGHERDRVAAKSRCGAYTFVNSDKPRRQSFSPASRLFFVATSSFIKLNKPESRLSSIPRKLWRATASFAPAFYATVLRSRCYEPHISTHTHTRACTKTRTRARRNAHKCLLQRPAVIRARRKGDTRKSTLRYKSTLAITLGEVLHEMLLLCYIPAGALTIPLRGTRNILFSRVP